MFGASLLRYCVVMKIDGLARDLPMNLLYALRRRTVSALDEDMV